MAASSGSGKSIRAMSMPPIMQSLLSVLYDALDVVLRDNALPHINSEIDHVLGHFVTYTVSMVLYKNTARLYVAIEALIVRFDKFTPCFRTEEETPLVSPVVVGVENVWFHTVDYMFNTLDFPIGIV